MSINHTFGLNVRVLSFSLPRNIIKDSDNVRVSITTLPEENKQAFVISARKMKDSHINFGVNVNIPQEKIPDEFITTGTERIIIIFRKKSFFYGYPIVGVASIDAKYLPRNLSEPAQIKVFKIYEPKKLNKQIKRNNDNGLYEIPESSEKRYANRQIIGSIQVQMSLTDPFQLKDLGDNEMWEITKDNSQSEHNYTNDLFKIGENHFRFRVLD